MGWETEEEVGEWGCTKMFLVVGERDNMAGVIVIHRGKEGEEAGEVWKVIMLRGNGGGDRPKCYSASHDTPVSSGRRDL